MLNLFSIQRACSDFLLYGHELLTPDHHVPEVNNSYDRHGQVITPTCRYPPTIVACVCIHLACKWSKYEIPLSGQVRPRQIIFTPEPRGAIIIYLLLTSLCIFINKTSLCILFIRDHIQDTCRSLIRIGLNI